MTFDPSAVRSGSVLSDNPNYNAAWLCYINGIEVPIVGCNVSYGVWQIPTFQLHVVPDPQLQRLGSEDRVQVAIFYLDMWADPEHPEFRLLVDGEIIGWSFGNISGQRVMSFSGMAHIHVFQQLFFFFMNTVDDIVAAQAPEVRVQGFSTPGLFYPYSLFHQGLFVNQAQVQNLAAGDAGAIDEGTAESAVIKAPYELVYNVVKGVIDKNVPNAHRSIPMMNFFARHIRRTRFHNRFVRLPVFEDSENLNDRKGVFPIFNAARNDEALIAMQRQVGSRVANSGPVWNLLQQTLGLVYMDLAMIPTAPCVRVSLAAGDEGRILGLLDASAPTVAQTGPNTVGAPTVATEALNAGQPAANLPQGPPREPAPPGVATTTPVRLAQYFVKPQFYFGIPPHCNVIFPSMIDQWTFDENYINQPTRIYVNDSVMSRLMRAQGANRELMLHALTVGYPEEADLVLHATVGSSHEPGSAATPANHATGKNLLIFPEEYFKGPVTARMEIPSWFQMLRQFQNGTARPVAGNDTTTGSAAPVPAPSAQTVTDPQGNANRVVASRAPVNPSPTANNVGAASAQTNVPQAETSPQPVALIGGQGYGARRILVGRTQVVSLNGTPVPRFRLRYGGGLDPDMYLPLERTALWPLPVGNFRGRTRAPQSRTEVQKRAQLQRLLMRHVPEFLEGSYSADQLFAISFGFLWNALTEGAAAIMFNWGFGNQKQYATSARQHWTQQVDRQPYIAARTPADGARAFIRRNLSGFRMPISVLLGQSRGPAPLAAFLSSSFSAADNAAWARYAPIRPDFFYVALGYAKYYAMESDQPGVDNDLRRAAIGRSRVGSISRWFNLIKGLFDAGTIPPDEITSRPYPHRPLLAPEDEAFLRAQGGASPNLQPARSAATPRVRVATAPPAEAGHPQAPTITVTRPADAATPGENNFTSLFRLYAQYEFLRQRYAERNVGALLQFNPYLVPGFPAALLDSMRTGMHVMTYVVSVSHTLFAGSGNTGTMKTQASLSFARTFAEFVQDVRNDCERFAERVTAAPAEIIDEIREIIQDEGQAEIFYQRLFYGGARDGRLPATFKFNEVFGYARGTEVEEIQITGESVHDSTQRRRVAREAAQDAANDGSDESRAPTHAQVEAVETPNNANGRSSVNQQTVQHNLDPNLALTPRDNIYQHAFDNYDIAMQLAARPVCTLTQYIRFLHAGQQLGDLIRRGLVEGLETDYAYARVVETDVNGQARQADGTSRPVTGPTERITAAYYRRIYQLRQGPGEAPNDHQRGYTASPNAGPSQPGQGLPVDYAQTRADWDSVLLAYRDRVRRLFRPAL